MTQTQFVLYENETHTFTSFSTHKPIRQVCN